MLGRMHMPTADGVGDVTNVQIAVRVNGDAVRGNKLRRPFAFFRFANAGLQLSMQIIDADPMPEAWGVINPTHTIQFANKEVALMVETDAIGSMDVIPHRHELAVGVEHLNAMRLTIGDVDVVIMINHYVMRGRCPVHPMTARAAHRG
jgi:hypothetical protein